MNEEDKDFIEQESKTPWEDDLSVQCASCQEYLADDEYTNDHCLLCGESAR